jgi:hypothetical protein
VSSAIMRGDGKTEGGTNGERERTGCSVIGVCDQTCGTIEFFFLLIFDYFNI